MTSDIQHFGDLPDGRAVQAITLRAGEVQATILTYGAILQDLRFQGDSHGLTLGSAALADYLGDMQYFGALVGPVANRISGAQAVVSGQTHHFQANEDAGTCLHSGDAGLHRKLWAVADAGPDHVTLQVDLPDGDGGFPGNRAVTVRFVLTAPATLDMTITARSDAPTWMNVANHSYWNLDGTAHWSGHRMQIAADHYTPTDADLIPQGEARAVTNTAFDFRTPRDLVQGQPDLDTNFCLSHERTPLRDVMRLTGQTGVSMVLATTEPGLQIYDGRAGIRPGHGPYEGVAIEAQGWPDAPNQSGFPSILLDTDQTYRQSTQWRFAQPGR